MARGSRLHCTHHPFTQVTRIGVRRGKLPNKHSRSVADPQAFVNPDCFDSDSSRANYALAGANGTSAFTAYRHCECALSSVWSPAKAGDLGSPLRFGIAKLGKQG